MTSGHHILEGHECVVQDTSYKPYQQTTVTTASKKRSAESKRDVTKEPRTSNTESSETKESCRDPSTAHSSENASITQKAETQENIFTTEKGKKKEKRGPKLLLEVRLERQTLSRQRPSSTGECVVRSPLRKLAILEKPQEKCPSVEKQDTMGLVTMGLVTTGKLVAFKRRATVRLTRRDRIQSLQSMVYKYAG